MAVFGWVLLFVGWCIFTYTVFMVPRGKRQLLQILTLLVMGLVIVINLAPVVIPD